MFCNSSIEGSLQSECPAKLSFWQYFTALFHEMSLPLSFAVHMTPVEGSIQYPRAEVSCADEP
jgi:hypothetical protein